MSKVKSYKKYVVQRSVGGKSVEKNDNGEPVLGKLIKDKVRITPEMAETLNHGWDSTMRPISFYWKEDNDETVEADKRQATKKSKSKKSIDKLKEQSDELFGLEIENKKLKLKKENEALNEESQKTPTKKELVSEAKELGIDSSGNVSELKERLANHKA